eukprot:CAMPEP_0168623464 /NCGR_PEP_ID=MMETSP0449_2-20121227/8843_1 /TAXON_ID=1082188 /ORGANISM="Strombidium rassoulzadegani, Strain ras09" /LENGTH=62 /DNA_ID=CAMNT_0008664855 /DNA_START=84 /DNA_END=272 /DNA_ORIENTATION=+
MTNIENISKLKYAADSEKQQQFVQQMHLALNEEQNLYVNQIRRTMKLKKQIDPAQQEDDFKY